MKLIKQLRKLPQQEAIFPLPVGKYLDRNHTTGSGTYHDPAEPTNASHTLGILQEHFLFLKNSASLLLLQIYFSLIQ